MLLEAIEHRPKLNWASSIDKQTVEIRIRTKRDDVSSVTLYAGDKYDWQRTSAMYEMKKLASDLLFDYWQVMVKPPHRRLRYAFLLNDSSQQLWLTEQGFEDSKPKDPNRFFDFPYINPADVFAPPAWVKDAVFYQIFPERFDNGSVDNDPDDVEEWGAEPTPFNFFGGDLQGVLKRLDYLTELGVNAVYFTPVFEAPTNHKYDTRDYYMVDPHFGTNETLRELVQACHARGIRVLLDAVFNHAGRTFPPFQDCLEQGNASRYADWFHVREWPLDVKDGIPTYETFAFERHMPKFNTENAEVQDYLLGVARYWLEEIGVDGWRLDVANEVDHRFWRRLRDTVKAANPDAYLLGEIWHDAIMWLQGDQFDAVMNYPFTTAVLDFFVEKKSDAKRFADSIGRLMAAYPTKVSEVAFNLLDSHDTPRLLTLCGGDKRLMKLAVLVQFTYIGTPCIYYGDEVGMGGGADPGCRRCMLWDEEEQDRELFAFYQSIIALRKSSLTLRTGSLTFLHAKEGSQAVVYSRSDESGQFIIAINNDKKQAVVEVQLEDAGNTGGEWVDAFTEVSFAAARASSLSLTLPPYGYLVLKQM